MGLEPAQLYKEIDLHSLAILEMTKKDQEELLKKEEKFRKLKSFFTLITGKLLVCLPRMLQIPSQKGVFNSPPQHSSWNRLRRA